MKELHESGLFFCKGNNGLFTAKMPSGVKNYKVYKDDGRKIEIFGKKIFYFRDLEVLEVALENGEKKFFQYRSLKKGFIEIEEEEI